MSAKSGSTAKKMSCPPFFSFLVARNAGYPLDASQLFTPPLMPTAAEHDESAMAPGFDVADKNDAMPTTTEANTAGLATNKAFVSWPINVRTHGRIRS